MAGAKLATSAPNMAGFIAGRRLWHPPVENRQHKAFRTVITLQIVRVFMGSAFVKGGIGYALFAWDMSTWRHADTALWLAAIALTALQGVWMTWHYSSRDSLRIHGVVA